MSTTWPFSSFGLDESISVNTTFENCAEPDNKNIDCDGDSRIANNSDDDIFYKDRLTPLTTYSKPMKRFLPQFGTEQKSWTETQIKQQSKTQNEFDESRKHRRTTDANKILNSRFLVKAKEMREFFRLTEDPVISDFLKMDSCKRIADKYLIAMVFAYFKRASITLKDYNRTNFFIALYLANDVEEDEEEIKYEILPWALGKYWRQTYVDFLRKRDWLFRRIGYKAIISRKCCDEIMNIDPDNWLWKRDRSFHHSGAVRGYMKDPSDNGIPRGPDASPLYCLECNSPDSQYDSASPNSLSWIISPDESPNK